MLLQIAMQMENRCIYGQSTRKLSMFLLDICVYRWHILWVLVICFSLSLSLSPISVSLPSSLPLSFSYIFLFFFLPPSLFPLPPSLRIMRSCTHS